MKTRKHAKDFTSQQIEEILYYSRGASAAVVADQFGTTPAVVRRLIRKNGGKRLPLLDTRFEKPPFELVYGPGGIAVVPIQDNSVFIMGVDDAPEAEATLKEIFKR